MRNILNVFVLLIVITFGIFACSGIIYASQTVTIAENFYETVCSEIEESYFDENIIEKCREKAQTKGYTLFVEDKSYNLYGEMIPAYNVKMEYPLRLSLFNINKIISIGGYVN